VKLLEGRPFDQWRDKSDRVIALYDGIGDETCGCFNVPLPTGEQLRVIASSGAGWDHVSISHRSRCPTWGEMVFVKRAFFKRGEWAVEYHPPEKENISLHDYCLHLWRPNNGIEFPLPPTWTIA
jgi:hypothetical protein